MIYIGNTLRERMNILEIETKELSVKSFVDASYIESILKNEISYEDIDEFSLNLLCSVLHCKPVFFTDSFIRNKDLVHASMNRGEDTEKSIKVKMRIQDYLNDIIFIDEILRECN